MASNSSTMFETLKQLVYEPFDARFREEPERFYERLRAEAPVYRSQAGYWILTRYEDVQAVFRQPERYSNAIVGREALSQAVGDDISLPEAGKAPVDLIGLLATPNMVSTDPPRHTELRRIVNRAFLPKRLEQWDDFIGACTAECLASVHDGEPWDVVAQLAMPLPVSVISRILSVGRERRVDIKRWSDTIISTAQGDERGTSQARMRMLGVLREFSECFVPIIEDRRKNLQNDMISDLVRAEEEALSTLDTLTFIKSLMLAGNETTTGLIGNTIVLLLQNPHQLAKVQADPGLLKNAIEESLRFRSPVQFSIRTPTEDVSIRGATIRRDEPIVLVIGSANRDPEAFPDAARFDVTRNIGGKHLAFGHGIHTCIGFLLARREATAALGAILPRLHQWRLSDAPLKRVESNFVYGYQEIQLIPR